MDTLIGVVAVIAFVLLLTPTIVVMFTGSNPVNPHPGASITSITPRRSEARETVGEHKAA